MRGRWHRCGAALGLGLALAALAGENAVADASFPEGTHPLATLPDGLSDEDAAAALVVFRRSCRASESVAPLRAAVPPPAALRSACATAEHIRPGGARAFFATSFTPLASDRDAFFTGYYEPVVAASRVATARFTAPLLAAPDGLVAIPPGRLPGLDPTLSVARRAANGRLVALPDRAGIESGSLAASARPLAFVASPVVAFFIQVQGSARLLFPDGRLRRLVYAARNGYPYTSIGKLLVARLNVPPSEMGMNRLRSWIEDHGQGANGEGTKLMRENRSFIFFRFDDSLPAEAGPIGAEGVSLTGERSLAIDRTKWPYGIPIWIDTHRPDGTPLRRLMVAQDTGSAIVGQARADIFFGTGDAAGEAAGAMRAPGALVALWPKPLAGSGHP